MRPCTGSDPRTKPVTKPGGYGDFYGKFETRNKSAKGQPGTKSQEDMRRRRGTSEHERESGGPNSSSVRVNLELETGPHCGHEHDYRCVRDIFKVTPLVCEVPGSGTEIMPAPVLKNPTPE
jgi:hypothetical protein